MENKPIKAAKKKTTAKKPRKAQTIEIRLPEEVYQKLDQKKLTSIMEQVLGEKAARKAMGYVGPKAKIRRVTIAPEDLPMKCY